jgi:formylglycine-generating enzyme
MPRALRRVTILAVAVASCGCGGSDVTKDAGGGAEASLPDGGVAQFASCAPGGLGVSSCGAASESCCTSLEVTGGTYFRTYEVGDAGATDAAAGGGSDPATVSNLRLDKYLVTVGRFRQFVNAWNGGSGYAPLSGSGKHTHLNAGQGLANAGSSGSHEPGWSPSDDTNIAPTDANLACESSATWTSAAGSQERLPVNCVNWFEAYAFCIWDGGFLPS